MKNLTHLLNPPPKSLTQQEDPDGLAHLLSDPGHLYVCVYVRREDVALEGDQQECHRYNHRDQGYRLQREGQGHWSNTPVRCRGRGETEGEIFYT
ncbi:hypothetical protein RRG08_066269 [Elysia crispata]|uniref:Uncharacterized protein n=1 Tax=Elysia crispata TaxID=231223 RepID=A0AAE1D288_9GAST|nr:hypothetical protein RRG08_066269 [Elysia crispata]